MRTQCSCGAQFEAGPELVGKQVKCPKCGNAFVVQGPQQSAPSQKSGVSQQPTGTIRVSCTCGGSFYAKQELAGKRIKCPKCSQPIAIPYPADRQTGAQSTNAHHFDISSKKQFVLLGLKVEICT